MSIHHRILETHQSSSRAEEQEPWWDCHTESKLRWMKQVGRKKMERKVEFEHSLTFLGPHQKKQMVGQTSRSKEMCSSLYLQTSRTRSSTTMTETHVRRDTNSSSYSLLVLLTLGVLPQRKQIFKSSAADHCAPLVVYFGTSGGLRTFCVSLSSSQFYFTTLYFLTKHPTVFIRLRNNVP